MTRITLSEATTGRVACRANHAWVGPALAAKIFRFAITPNHPYNSRHPAPMRGAYRDRHGRWVRDAMDVAASGATESQGELRLVSDRPARRRLALKRLRRNLGRQHMSRPKRFGGGSRGRQRRVVLAPVAGVKLMETCRALPGFGRSPIRQRRRPKEFGSGESALYALKPLRREGRVFRRTLRSPVCILCARSRVLRAPGFPCALFDFEGIAIALLRAPRAARMRRCVCSVVIPREGRASSTPRPLGSRHKPGILDHLLSQVMTANWLFDIRIQGTRLSPHPERRLLVFCVMLPCSACSRMLFFSSSRWPLVVSRGTLGALPGPLWLWLSCGMGGAVFVITVSTYH